ncbi:winged helix-turn-helix domain-containing protein [Natrinema sp. 1APR25-10V2]|uniref:winged helix-turn-helix domain-containing protein n=1 Tax=Natrinema sp. 1APR25-10V2 TaxID=2951081 RepID=UPI002876D666|nr:winged helix-turn-helix domain-containing protein [Natrinema sp. 1APR25-10V2]MDS0473774.1 winged helix-turn-helix domain-containing protein [Natrinema sp. 1APR25-10V2]
MNEKIEIDHYAADFRILQHLLKGRNLPSNLADDLDLSPEYVRTRLRKLRRAGMVEHVGEPDRGLYQITDRGEVALDFQDKWDTAADRDEYRQIVAEADPSRS